MEGILRLNRKHQIVIPREIRKQLGLAPGDGLLVEVRDGCVVLVPRPRNYTRRLRGLHKEVWGTVEATTYVKKERRRWL